MDDGSVGDVFYVDTRNADARDHRVGRTAVVTPRRPGYAPAADLSSRVSYAGPAYAAPAAAMAPQGFLGPQQPVYVQPPMWNQPATLGNLFGGLNSVNIGTLVDLIGQGFAAIRSLPTPPPTATGESSSDITNLGLYQQALAEHGKTDEQIRTAVHIIGKLLGA